MADELISGASNLEANLVVVGGGGSGLAAALAAAERGIHNIVVLEKRSGLGGNTARATGLFACESPTQGRERIIADKDKIFEKAVNWAHWSRINPRILRAFFNKSGDTIRWLEEKGLEFTVIAFFANQNPRVEHVPKGKGAQLTQVLAEQCREKGVRIILHGTGSKIQFENNRITAVLAKIDDEYIRIKTDCVIIATGGFGGNQELLSKFCPLYYEGMPLRGLPLQGDGIQMASEAGACIEDFVTLLKEGPRIDLNTWPLDGLEREPVTIWVNKNGLRFTDEGIGIHPFESVNPILNQPDKICYSLLDSSIKDKFQTKTKKDPDSALRIEIANGRVKGSDSWDEIARWTGAIPEVLNTTIDEYNKFCDQGYDAQFAKERRYLYPLRKPPFYAIRGLPHFLDTLGGIRVNENMEVLKTDNTSIPGLYAAGVTTSGWEAETYCSDLSGSAFGYAINSGRIAGESASEFINPTKK
jgi:fumarate reductase flavoprotein subunit